MTQQLWMKPNKFDIVITLEPNEKVLFVQLTNIHSSWVLVHSNHSSQLLCPLQATKRKRGGGGGGLPHELDPLRQYQIV